MVSPGRDLAQGWAAGVAERLPPAAVATLGALIDAALTAARDAAFAEVLALARGLADEQRSRAGVYAAAGGEQPREIAGGHNAQFMRAEGAVELLDRLMVALTRQGAAPA